MISEPEADHTVRLVPRLKMLGALPPFRPNIRDAVFDKNNSAFNLRYGISEGNNVLCLFCCKAVYLAPAPN